MPITIRRIEDQDLNIFVVVGMLLNREQLNAIKSFYEGEPTANVLWDFREVKGAAALLMK